MKKLFVFLMCLFAGSAAFAQLETVEKRINENLKRAVSNTATACFTAQCLQKAVYDKNFRRVENTLKEAVKSKNNPLLNVAVDLDGKRITVVEYLVQLGYVGEARRMFPYYYPSAAVFGTDHWDDYVDNLLEKLTVSDSPARFLFARDLLDLPTTVAISTRTFHYALSRAISAEGFQFVKVLGSKRVGGINTHHRDDFSYPMPYVFSSEMRDGHDILANELKFATTAEQKRWLGVTSRYIAQIGVY